MYLVNDDTTTAKHSVHINHTGIVLHMGIGLSRFHFRCYDAFYCLGFEYVRVSAHCFRCSVRALLHNSGNSTLVDSNYTHNCY